jgi:hypothetical protein
MNFFQGLKRWVRYAYFLRFSLVLWFFAPVLCLLDAFYTKSLTSGILTPEALSQYACVGFFLVSAAFVALITARVVLINGPERWDECFDKLAVPALRNDGRPPFLTRLLVNPEAKLEWGALLISQIPCACADLYLVINAGVAGVPFTTVILGLHLGGALAWIMWGIANAWYYLTYIAVEATSPNDRVAFGQNAARTLLFPRSLFRLTKPGDFYSENTLEGASTGFENSWPDRLLRGIARLVEESRTPGYVYPPGQGAKFFEAHTFAILSVGVFVGLYLLIWPLTAPVPAILASLIALALMVVFCFILVLFFWKDPPPPKPGVHRRWKWRLSIAVIAFLGTIAYLYCFTSAERFPIFATILIMVTALTWILGGLAFFLDRYRVPVLTIFLLAVVAPRLVHLDRAIYWELKPGQHWPLHWGNSQEEHYLSAISLDPTDPLAMLPVPTPSEILARALAENIDDRPLIIVTATGGGLHASAWTAAVLAQLEARFDADTNQSGSFHNHLLLASTVSGGSVGLLSYLQELKASTPDFTRMQVATQCSSLEAAGWGLVYYDLQKAVVPLFPYFVSPSSGENDLDRSPLWKDRTWSLRKAFSRNSQNAYCRLIWDRDSAKSTFTRPQLLIRSNFRDERNSNEVFERNLTLRALIPSNNNLPGTNHPFPAFAMNTTAAETGERFLLANYRLPDEELDTPPNYKARSFLETFKSTGADAKTQRISDLPLATAAQMSATFPYVSSAARVPMLFDNNIGSVHFVDGGYYDNDGTASAGEFLRYALVEPNLSSVGGNAWSEASTIPRERTNRQVPTDDSVARPRLRILLIEIRNSGDIAGNSGPESGGYHSGDTTPSNLLGQVGAPLLAFWQAGHESVTARNRVLLAQLEHALSGKLLVHRVVLADLRSQIVVATDPLSWSLTPAQRKEVHETANGKDIVPLYKDASNWFLASQQYWQTHADSDWPE